MVKYLEVLESILTLEEAKREFGLVIRHGSVHRTQSRVCGKLLGVGGGHYE
jgi:hypothetical protein